MRLYPVLADTCRPGSLGNVSLLNAGWSFTTAMPVVPPEEGWSLPSQALCTFIEADWDELNRSHSVVMELVNEDEERIMMAQAGGLVDARIELPITIPSVPGAPNGTPGRAQVFVDLCQGSIRIRTAPARYIWRVAIGQFSAEVGFWVNAPAAAPRIG